MTSDTTTNWFRRQQHWLARRRALAAAILNGASYRQLATLEHCSAANITQIAARELTPEQRASRWEARWQWKEEQKRLHPPEKRNWRHARDRKQPKRPEWVPLEQVKQMLQAVTVEEAIQLPVEQLADKMRRAVEAANQPEER